MRVNESWSLSWALRCLCFIVSLSCCPLAFGAEFRTVLRPTCIASGVLIQGRIERGDTARFLATLRQITSRYGKERCEEGFTYVWLNSEGGEVGETIRIGREIRANKLGTMVDDSASCMSSCVLLLAAGVTRIAGGDVAIHRPYFSALSATASQNEVRQRREALNAEIRSYLQEIDVPTTLLDEMLSVAPDELRKLKDTELRRFRLIGDDPTFEEMKTARNAADYGMTSSTYRVALSESIEKCTGKEDFSECQTAVILKIPLSEAKRRHANLRGRCNISDPKQFRECFKSIVILGR